MFPANGPGRLLVAVTHERFVLLNRLVSASRSRAPVEHKPPLVEGEELVTALKERQEAKGAIEFFGKTDTEREADETDAERVARCAGLDFIWLRQIRISKRGAYKYAALLLEFVDQSKTKFSVVDTDSLKGRDISGGKNERGGISAHVVIRLPISQHDDGTYRCAIEQAPSINRGVIETFICRQLRRWAHENELTYEVHTPDKRTGKATVKEYRYTPRLELMADIGRSISFATASGRELAQMVFSKRSEKRSIGGKDHVVDEEVLADVEIRIAAKQGPSDAEERYKWLSKIRSSFEKSGYTTRLIYKQINGGTISGKVHEALAGATDLVICPKELMTLKHEPRDWYAEFDEDVIDQMIAFLDKEGLWQRAK